MDVDNISRKGRICKGKGKGKGHYKEIKGKGKGYYKGFDKGRKETTTKEDTTKAKEKANPKAMGQAKATKAKETTANQKEKEATTT